jgi:hypothetical protein
MPDTNQNADPKTQTKHEVEAPDSHPLFNSPENQKTIAQALQALDELVTTGKQILNHPKLKPLLDQLKRAGKPFKDPKQG